MYDMLPLVFLGGKSNCWGSWGLKKVSVIAIFAFPLTDRVSWQENISFNISALMLFKDYEQICIEPFNGLKTSIECYSMDSTILYNSKCLES